MAADLSFGTGSAGASRTYTPAARKSDGTLAAQTDTPIVEVTGLVSAVAGNGPGTDAFTITPSDSANFSTNARSLYVGGAGDVVVVTPGGSVVTFKAVPAGSILPVQAKRVNATSTTATNLVGLV